MVLEMKRALEELRKGADGAYRKIYDATYEEVYCKSLLITQEEKQALSLVEDFYADVLKEIGEALKEEDQNFWFWQQYYKKIRREYQKLLSVQHKEAPGKAQNLAQILAALPLLHRVMLLMAYEDNFTVEQISAVIGLAAEKIEGELEKLEKILPNMTQGQPQENEVWLAGWRTILAGASRQILGTVAADWVDAAYEKAAAAAGVKEQPKKAEDDFEYFVADADLPEEKPKKKKAEPVIEDEEDEEEYSDDEEDEDEEYDDDDEEYDEEDDEDDRYDWDLEDDGRKMIIIGAVVAVILCVVIGVGVMWFMGKDKSDTTTPSQSEEQQEDAAADLVIKGDGDTTDETDTADEADAEAADEADAETEDASADDSEEAEAEEPQTVTMKVKASSLNVRSEANTTSSVVTSLANGDTVEVLGDTSQEWVQIRCTGKNNEEGYVKSEYLVAAE